jgi:glycosyltransferase involved in cell wall biosynthesis
VTDPSAAPVRPLPRVSGFTIVRNAERLDFPVVESLRSILSLCDEVVVNVGRSDDATLELVESLADPRIRIVETEWDLGRGYRLLAEQTAVAMRACRGTWGVYIQADEVLHERGLPALRRAMDEVESDPRVEGLLVRYRHFYGHPDLEAVHRHWYRREVRVVRLDSRLDIHPFRDAQGFRVGTADRRIRAHLVDAEMFHYGWTRAGRALRSRREDDRTLYGRDGRADDPAVLGWFPGLRPFRGTHPAVALEWVERQRHDPDRRVAEPRFAWRHLRARASDLLERITGTRPFEFRNYTRV